MWLRAAWRGHLAFCLSGQLCHLLALFTRTVGRQHGHRHRSYHHGDWLSRLPGRHQGEQVPASECEFKPDCLRNSLTDLGHSLCSRLLSYTFDSSHTLMQAVLWMSHGNPNTSQHLRTHRTGQEKLTSLSVVLQLEGKQQRNFSSGRLELSLSVKEHTHTGVFQSKQ